MGKLCALSRRAMRDASPQTLPARVSKEKPSVGAVADCRPSADGSGRRELLAALLLLLGACQKVKQQPRAL
jgi:hypothetical protein